MRHHFAVGVVGGGPAGSRAAELLARRGASVVLLDPKAPWEKPCGGGLTPPLFDEVPELNEVKPFARPVDRIRIESGAETGLAVNLSRPIWVIPRKDLGRWQLERAIAAGVKHEPAKVEKVHWTDGGWDLDTESGSLRVSYLVGADGAASTVRRSVAPDFQIELVPTRVAYPRRVDGAAETIVLRFFEGVVGYLWDFPRPDHDSVGVEATAGIRSRPAFDAKIDEYRECGAPGAHAPPRAGAVIGTAGLGHGSFSGVAGPRFALLGDAAGFADPFTGEGIRNALRSAALLARAWENADGVSSRYIALARRAFAREFRAARLLRRALAESGLGVRLVRRASSSDLAYTVVAAVLESLTLHDYRVLGYLKRWSAAMGDLREAPEPRRAKDG